MDSKYIRGGDSIPASTSLFPQLRHSRRGSLASSASANQFDRETLSQALDQIHSTASQVETLTTFNEYTAPPTSSSRPESKGIASELQGGLSGLYSRLRASVGNVKDIVNIGGEDTAGDISSPKGSKVALRSPTPSMKESVYSSQNTDFSTSIHLVHSVGESGRESPSSISNTHLSQKDPVRDTYLGGTNGPSTSALGSMVASMPHHATLTQLPHPTTTSSALAVDAGNQADLGEELLPNTKLMGSHNVHLPGREPELQESKSFSDPIRINIEHTNTSDSEHGQLTEGTRDARLENTSKASIRTGQSVQEPKTSSRHPSFPAPRTGEGNPTTELVPALWPETKSSEGAFPRALPGRTSSVVESVHNDDRLQFKHQPLGLLPRKTTAPPIVTRSKSPNPSMSRASSSDTDIQSSQYVPLQAEPHSGRTESLGQHPIKGNTFQPSAISATQYEARTLNVSSQVKNKVLNKEYWMKDENARDCFYCGDTFSTFRRKHHCRTCGQIFDAKCTSILSGLRFGQAGTLRVCKPCEGIINGEDDSSEGLSDDAAPSIRGLRPRHGSTGASDILATPNRNMSPSSKHTLHRSPVHPDLTVPTISIPATRKAGGDSSRRAPVLEIEAERTLPRPSSSRSLKSSLGTKAYHSGHKRHNSRHFYQRSFQPVNEDNAPFHQNSDEGNERSQNLPAFHDDNIIDPDLAPFLSDEGSSGDEQINIMAAFNGDGLSRSQDNERHGISSLLASSKKLRSKAGDKSNSGVTFTSRDPDSYSLSSSKAANAPPRYSKRRNMSVAGNANLGPLPRSHRPNSAIANLGQNLQEGSNNSSLIQVTAMSDPVGGIRMIRSSSMRGAAAPAIELNHASLRHVRKLLHQLLQDSKVPNVASWEKALMPILLRATDDVNPDVQNGDDIDIRHYVKLKKIPGGRPGDTSYVSGLVFSKNLALKCMPRTMSHPSILILTFALEYARHQQHFMSLEPVIRQEREFLQNLVNRIAALRPQLLLVEKNVSGLALEFLEQANIATAYNVKASVLEATSRCCQTRIISSIDKLAVKPAQAGKCASFYLKTYLDGSRKKTYMFLSGCAKELGCTIVLRGDNESTLAKVKRISEFMIYVVYNLKLETCFMRDEFALIPSNTELGSFSPGEEHSLYPFKALSLHHSERPEDQATAHSHTPLGKLNQNNRDPLTAKSSSDGKRDTFEKEKSKPALPDDDSVPEDTPMPTFYGDMVEEYKTKILSASPFVKFMQPYLLMRAREQERRLAYLNGLRERDSTEEQSHDEKPRSDKFDLITPEMVHEKVPTASSKVREVVRAVQDAEYDKALHNYQTQTKQWEAYISGNVNLFDPSAHQNIAVLYSVVCTATTIPCSGPDMLALGFYNEHETDADFEADCTLGQYVEDLCLGANTVCTANGCERKMFEHHRQYVHGEAQLSVFVEQYPCKLRGLQDTILMWSICRICNKETQVMPMSLSTWKYSFGKYLELSFWSSELHARADICPHDLHRDHLRYFGFKDMAIRVHYDPITLLEIIVPRARITWKVNRDLHFKNDVFTKIESRLSRFMQSVKARIQSINVEGVLPAKTESCKKEIEKLSQRAAEEHHTIILSLREKYMDSKHYQVIHLNRAIIAAQERVAEWDNAFADLEHNFFPSEKDIRRLATLQLKKIFLDRDDSVTSINPGDDSPNPSTYEPAIKEKAVSEDIPVLSPQTRRMSPEKTHDMLAAVVEKNVSPDSQPSQHQEGPTTTPQIQESVSIPAPPSLPVIDKEHMRHLDLAVKPDHSCTSQNRSSQSIDRSQPTVPADRSIDSSNPGPSDAAKHHPNSGGVVPHALAPQQEPSKDPVSSMISNIPRPVEVHHRATRSAVSPSLSRMQSQPAHLPNAHPNGSSSHILNLVQQQPRSEDIQKTSTSSFADATKSADRKLTDKIGTGALKSNNVTIPSMIPRAIKNMKNDSKVSSLAKHFEQLSREFEKERIRERRQRAAKSRQARAYPMIASKPIVEVYRNVHEAVEEKEPSDEDLLSSDPSIAEKEQQSGSIHRTMESAESESPGEGARVEQTTAENTETDDNANVDSHVGSDIEGDEQRGEGDHSLLDDIRIPGVAGDHQVLSSDEAHLDIKLDLPKHEKGTLMKTLTKFWAERSASGWQPLEYPLNATDHIFADSGIIVREDEPSSLIAFALDSQDYQMKLRSIIEAAETSNSTETKTESWNASSEAGQPEVEDSLLRPTGTHLKYQFTEGSAKMLCKVFYAEQFDAVRRKCGVSERIVESLSRCAKWDSKGGKTKSIFLKTLDDRFVLKSLSTIETQAFLRFAPAYFRIMSESLFHELPSVIAKMLGFYQVIIKNPVTGTEFNWFLLVMENLFYDREPTRIFDLKGSMRNRRIQSTGEQNEVLLDENMVEFIYESPLFAREHSKKLLRASVWNDTLFLSRQNVMDYSLMIAIDENRRELVVGIIDCIRTYTWDKKLESWIKDRGKNRPTVTSPKEYKSRFREAMGRYVLQAPNCWHQFKPQLMDTRPLRSEDPGDDREVQVQRWPLTTGNNFSAS